MVIVDQRGICPGFEEGIIVSDPVLVHRDVSRNALSRFKKSVGKLRTCLETSDWNIDIALFLVISNSICFAQLFSPSDQGEKEVLSALWPILTGLGAFVIPPGILPIDVRGYPLFAPFYIVQILAALSLLAGIYYKQVAGLQIWLAVNLLTCIHSTWWNLHLLVGGQEDLALPISNGFLLGSVFWAYYVFNGLYMWRIYGLHRSIVASPSFSESGISCPFTSWCCLACTAVCSLFASAKIITYHPRIERMYEDTFLITVALGLFFMFWTCSKLLMRLMCGKEAENQVWSYGLVVVLIISAIFQYRWISSPHNELLVNYLSRHLVLRLLFLDWPASMSILLAHRWLRGIMRGTVENTSSVELPPISYWPPA